MAYAKAQLLLSACEAEAGNLQECLRRLDMMLLMGPGGLHGQVNTLVDRVERLMDRQGDQPQQTAAVPIEGQPVQASSPPVQPRAAKRPRSEASPCEDTIPRITPPSLLGFMEQYVRCRRPVILTGCMDDWPAISRREDLRDRAWADTAYLKRVAGRRTVPVEVGSGTYLSNEWGQRLMRVSEFIDRFITGQAEGEEERGYLAQHELFEQIPQLRRDILTPDYCALDDDDDDGDDDDDDDHEQQPVAVNAWFGPGGTVSPTHTDPYHNLLAQVVGSKEVWLFAPSESKGMYPCPGLMSNNSQVRESAPRRTGQEITCLLRRRTRV